MKIFKINTYYTTLHSLELVDSVDVDPVDIEGQLHSCAREFRWA